MSGDPVWRDCRVPSLCRDCGQSILWALWPHSGKKMPVNAEPRLPPYGQVLLSYRAAQNRLIATMARGRSTLGRRLFESHLATCSGQRALEMRKGKPPQGSARRAA